jgi:hypothetical protein
MKPSVFLRQLEQLSGFEPPAEKRENACQCIGIMEMRIDW